MTLDLQSKRAVPVVQFAAIGTVFYIVIATVVLGELQSGAVQAYNWMTGVGITLSLIGIGLMAIESLRRRLRIISSWDNALVGRSGAVPGFPRGVSFWRPGQHISRISNG
jgi:uncharacterized protein YacL